MSVEPLYLRILAHRRFIQSPSKMSSTNQDADRNVFSPSSSSSSLSLSDPLNEDVRDSAEEYEKLSGELFEAALEILEAVDQNTLEGQKIAASSNEIIKICERDQACNHQNKCYT